jgi:hypothetical protein
MAKSKEQFERLPDGRFRLKSTSGSFVAGIIILIFGAIWLGVTLGVFSANDMDGGSWIFFGCFSMVGLGALALGGGILIHAWMVGSTIHGAAVILNRIPLRLGETFTVEYEQQAKRAMAIDQVTLELICQEWVQYQQGTDTQTATKDVFEHKLVLLESGEVPAKWRLTGTGEFNIPADRMHSFSANNNKIKWFLRLRTEISSWPDYKADFPIEVSPLIAAESAT